jgi:peptidyl-tRNA hydrolase
MNENKKQISRMYVLVRQDIDPGYQIPQSIHAKDAFTHDYPEIENRWYKESNTLVVLGVKDEEELLFWTSRAKQENLKTSLFYEPDVDQYTALAIEPGNRTTELLKTLKPACREYRNLTK